MSQNIWAIIMPFGPVTNFLLAQKKFRASQGWLSFQALFLCFSLVHLDQRSIGTIAITWCLVVCKLFTFQASSPKPLGQLEPNLAGMFRGWSSTKLLFFVSVGYSTWPPGPIIC